MITEKQERYINYLFRTKNWQESDAVCRNDISRIHYLTKYEASCLISDLLQCDDKEDIK